MAQDLVGSNMQCPTHSFLRGLLERLGNINVELIKQTNDVKNHTDDIVGSCPTDSEVMSDQDKQGSLYGQIDHAMQMVERSTEENRLEINRYIKEV